LDIFEMAVLVVTLNLEISILSVELGTRVREQSDRALLTLAFAFLHCAASLIGFLLGAALNSFIGVVSRYLSSVILIGVGSRILVKALEHHKGSFSPADITLILVGAGIEDIVGAFSVGTGTFGGRMCLMILLFFAVSVPMNLMAFRLGDKLERLPDLPVNMVTGVLLVFMGVLSVFGII